MQLRRDLVRVVQGLLQTKCVQGNGELLYSGRRALGQFLVDKSDSVCVCDVQVSNLCNQSNLQKAVCYPCSWNLYCMPAMVVRPHTRRTYTDPVGGDSGQKNSWPGILEGLAATLLRRATVIVVCLSDGLLAYCYTVNPIGKTFINVCA